MVCSLWFHVIIVIKLCCNPPFYILFVRSGFRRIRRLGQRRAGCEVLVHGRTSGHGRARLRPACLLHSHHGRGDVFSHTDPGHTHHTRDAYGTGQGDDCGTGGQWRDGCGIKKKNRNRPDRKERSQANNTSWTLRDSGFGEFESA